MADVEMSSVLVQVLWERRAEAKRRIDLIQSEMAKEGPVDIELSRRLAEQERELATLSENQIARYAEMASLGESLPCPLCFIDKGKPFTLKDVGPGPMNTEAYYCRHCSNVIYSSGLVRPSQRGRWGRGRKVRG